MSPSRTKVPVVLSLVAVLLTIGGVLTPGPLAQQAAAPPLTESYEFAFTRFLGEHGKAVAVDKAGYVYLAATGRGVRGRSDEIRDAFARTLQVPLGSDDDDAFVAKFTPDGQTLVDVKTLGGEGSDAVDDIAVDESGHVYVIGSTESRDFPTTSQALQPRIGGATDCFVVKLSRDGAVLYLTFLGGRGREVCRAIAADTAGNAYVTGGTQSPTFGASKTPPSPGLRGNDDAFVAKLDADGHALQYLRVLGGSRRNAQFSFPERGRRRYRR